uniref:beta-defensin 107A-like n=1 Tax=Panthera onca TaxID=9690 RepID=UPI00295509A0|nr:beta-defensin 107A-like [Panthera onca]
MSGAMRIFFLIFAALILLAGIFSGRNTLLLDILEMIVSEGSEYQSCFLHLASGGMHREPRCLKLDSHREAECLSFEVKIGGCRTELTPLC